MPGRAMAGLRLLLGLCLWALCPGPAPACSPRCRHGGLCLADGSCLCSKGYEGERCQHGKAGRGQHGKTRRAGASTVRRAGTRQGRAQALVCSLSCQPSGQQSLREGLGKSGLDLV